MSTCNQSVTQRSGVSLLEIILATVVLTVAAAIVMAYVRQPSERVKREACNLRVEQLQLLVRQHAADTGSLPARDLRQLTAERYLGSPLPVCPLDGRAYGLDTRGGQIVPHGHP